ncbi:hypothetical protein BOTNAR_0013g00130 [Botryotinia narcissicola]|uniref:Carboxylesterase type B domain-containing protein n=1 Tax=Botryotinia narcissicola TaxID=278944 RepID=A0A4Z1J6L7_9HELO|nr:hypothetical protein BOTNAR_0013g00130 [Botryotinia narcissicola]
MSNIKTSTPLKFLLIASIIPQVWSWEVGNGVQTSSGFVHRYAASNTFVTEYLGIPNAQPPIGELRFAAPQRYPGNNSINGTDFISSEFNISTLFFSDFPDMPLRENINSGVYHGVEIYHLFCKTLRGVGIPQRTAQEVDLGRYMMEACATFAKDPHMGLRKLGWSIFSPGEDTLICLGLGNITALDMSGSSEYDSGCPSAFPV